MKTKQAKAKNSQHKKFIGKARELECDEDEAAFEDKLRRIVPKPKPKEEAPQRPKKGDKEC